MIFKFVILQVYKILKLYFIFHSILQNAIDLLFDLIDTNKNGLSNLMNLFAGMKNII